MRKLNSKVVNSNSLIFSAFHLNSKGLSSPNIIQSNTLIYALTNKLCLKSSFIISCLVIFIGSIELCYSRVNRRDHIVNILLGENIALIVCDSRNSLCSSAGYLYSCRNGYLSFCINDNSVRIKHKSCCRRNVNSAVHSKCCAKSAELFTLSIYRCIRSLKVILYLRNKSFKICDLIGIASVTNSLKYSSQVIRILKEISKAIAQSLYFITEGYTILIVVLQASVLRISVGSKHSIYLQLTVRSGAVVDNVTDSSFHLYLGISADTVDSINNAVCRTEGCLVNISHFVILSVQSVKHGQLISRFRSKNCRKSNQAGSIYGGKCQAIYNLNAFIVNFSNSYLVFSSKLIFGRIRTINYRVCVGNPNQIFIAGRIISSFKSITGDGNSVISIIGITNIYLIISNEERTRVKNSSCLCISCSEIVVVAYNAVNSCTLVCLALSTRNRNVVCNKVNTSLCIVIAVYSIVISLLSIVMNRKNYLVTIRKLFSLCIGICYVKLLGRICNCIVDILYQGCRKVGFRNYVLIRNVNVSPRFNRVRYDAALCNSSENLCLCSILAKSDLLSKLSVFNSIVLAVNDFKSNVNVNIKHTHIELNGCRICEQRILDRYISSFEILTKSTNKCIKSKILRSRKSFQNYRIIIDVIDHPRRCGDELFKSSCLCLNICFFVSVTRQISNCICVCTKTHVISTVCHIEHLQHHKRTEERALVTS